MRTLILAASLLLATPAMAADTSSPAQLLAEKCSRCHGSEVYTRPNRLVISAKALDSRVRNCDAMTSAGLSEGDISALVKYLNDNFYKF